MSPALHSAIRVFTALQIVPFTHGFWLAKVFIVTVETVICQHANKANCYVCKFADAV